MAVAPAAQGLGIGAALVPFLSADRAAGERGPPPGGGDRRGPELDLRPQADRQRPGRAGPAGRSEKTQADGAPLRTYWPVSYTHLTLPTIYSV